MSCARDEASAGARTARQVSARGLLVVGASALAVGAAILQFAYLAQAASRGNLAVDLRQAYVPAAEAILHGENPYPDLTDAELARGDAYVYPPLVAFATIPLTFLDSPNGIATVIGVVAVIAALLLVGLNDWRCFAAALGWVPVFHGVQTANVTLLLLLGTALAWRLRQREHAEALASGLTISAKLVTWPLVVWLAATRRYAAAFGALLVTFVATLTLWAVIGFDGLTAYWDRAARLSDLESESSYTFPALAIDLGAPKWFATLVGLLLAAICIVSVIATGRSGDDERSFSFSTVAVVVASPIVWLHSFALLLVPLALTRPRFSVIWLLPAALWFASGTGNGTTAQNAYVLVVMSVVAIYALSAPTEERRWTGRTRLARE